MNHSIRTGLLLATLLLTVLATAAWAAVEITFFEGRWQNNRVQLMWGTGSEADHAGFNVWRSRENLPILNGQIDTSQAQKLNSSLIRNPDGPCELAGRDDYQFTDSALEKGQTVYYYYLESLHCNSSGSSFEADGTGSGLEVRFFARYYLPLISSGETP